MAAVIGDQQIERIAIDRRKYDQQHAIGFEDRFHVAQALLRPRNMFEHMDQGDQVIAAVLGGDRTDVAFRDPRNPLDLVLILVVDFTALERPARQQGPDGVQRRSIAAAEVEHAPFWLEAELGQRLTEELNRPGNQMLEAADVNRRLLSAALMINRVGLVNLRRFRLPRRINRLLDGAASRAFADHPSGAPHLAVRRHPAQLGKRVLEPDRTRRAANMAIVKTDRRRRLGALQLGNFRAVDAALVHHASSSDRAGDAPQNSGKSPAAARSGRRPEFKIDRSTDLRQNCIDRSPKTQIRLSTQKDRGRSPARWMSHMVSRIASNCRTYRGWSNNIDVCRACSSRRR